MIARNKTKNKIQKPVDKPSNLIKKVEQQNDISKPEDKGYKEDHIQHQKKRL